jgi:hypothetical protein
LVKSSSKPLTDTFTKIKHVVKNLYFGLLGLLLALAACKNEKEKGPKVIQPNDPLMPDTEITSGPKDIKEVKQVVAEIDGMMDTLQKKGPLFVREVPEFMTEVSVFSSQGKNLILHTKTPVREAWYYLVDERPIYLREQILGKEGFTEHRFYYGRKDLLAAETREGASPDALEQAEAKKYRSEGDDDYRMGVKTVFGKYMEYTMGKVKQAE